MAGERPASAGEAPEQAGSGFGPRGRVTIRDVAREAEVSLGTVSRVLNKASNVRREARLRVLDAAERLGYVPDAIAQSMRRQASRAIGCMVSDVANPLFASAVSAAENVLHLAGYNMILANSGDDPRREDEILTLFRSRRLDGVIMTLAGDNQPVARARVHALGMPAVLIERQIADEVDTVASDHFGGTLQALDYLLNLGHQRIGLVTTSTGALPGRARVEAFRHAFSRRALPLDEGLLFTHGLSSDYGFAATQSLLSMPRPPTAILAGANQMPGVLDAVRLRGTAIPDELSVVALGDSDLARLYDPPLTALRWRAEVTGRIAAEILLRRLEAERGEHAFRAITLPTEFVVRQSCGPPCPRA